MILHNIIQMRTIAEFRLKKQCTLYALVNSMVFRNMHKSIPALVGQQTHVSSWLLRMYHTGDKLAPMPTGTL